MILTQDILNKVKQRTPFFQKQAINSNIFSWAELEGLLNLRPMVKVDRFFINFIRSDLRPTYNWINPNWATENAYPASLIQEEIKKYVCFLIDCSKANRSINEICAQLEDVSKAATDAHIFFSFITKDLSFDQYVHKDVSDNLIVQIDGKTNFKVWDTICPREHFNKPVLDVVMEPGDIIYIPKDIWHGAFSLTKRLSVSFPMAVSAPAAMEDRHWISLSDPI